MRSISSSNLFIDKVYPIVTDYVFNEEYILVEQEPSKKFYRSLIAQELEFKYNILTTTDSTSKELAAGQYDFFKRELLTKKELYRILKERLTSNEKDSASLYIVDSLLKNSPYKEAFLRKKNYWIISHKEKNGKVYHVASKVYGPFSKKDYLAEREILAIPQKLKLSSETN